MNRITRFAALAWTFAAAGSAFADDITIDTATHQMTMTRAAVQAELKSYKQAGVNPWSTSYNVLAGFQGQRSRADVQAEMTLARASGELSAMTSEDSGSAYMAQAQRPVARTTVVAAVR